ncbi:tetratricopeptide repeat protein [Streptomyces sp. NPDC088394]|uniref:tetratricopeptide repeat protein n=1 Tax=Streptomyces sp. NPDC088394 TaxID=3365860 RepID=UPI003813D865
MDRGLEQAAHDSADTVLLSWSGRFRDAIADAEPAVVCLTALLTHGRLGAGARVWAHTYRGRHLYLAERDEEALTEFDQALATEPHNILALVFRGETHRLLGQITAAVTDFTAALDIDPADVRALGCRGEAHRDAGRYDQAVTDLTTALDIDPTSVWALIARSHAHRQGGRYDQAREDLEWVLQAEPGNLGGMFERVILDTATSGLGACVEQWRQLLASPVVVTVDADLVGFFDLLQVLVLEPEADAAEAAEVFLAGGQDPEVISDMLECLAELSAAGDRLADRARLCRQLIAERT